MLITKYLTRPGLISQAFSIFLWSSQLFMTCPVLMCWLGPVCDTLMFSSLTSLTPHFPVLIATIECKLAWYSIALWNFMIANHVALLGMACYMWLLKKNCQVSQTKIIWLTYNPPTPPPPQRHDCNLQHNKGPNTMTEHITQTKINVNINTTNKHTTTSLYLTHHQLKNTKEVVCM